MTSHLKNHSNRCSFLIYSLSEKANKDVIRWLSSAGHYVKLVSTRDEFLDITTLTPEDYFYHAVIFCPLMTSVEFDLEEVILINNLIIYSDKRPNYNFMCKLDDLDQTYTQDHKDVFFFTASSKKELYLTLIQKLKLETKIINEWMGESKKNLQIGNVIDFSEASKKFIKPSK